MKHVFHDGNRLKKKRIGLVGPGETARLMPQHDS